MWQAWPQPVSLRVPVASTSLTSAEEAYVMKALSRNWVGPNGPFGRQAQEALTDLIGQPALVTSNGSVALYVALKALDIGPGDEVIVPSTTYAATANAVVAAGASPVFCDVEERTWGLDVGQVPGLLSPNTKAIIAVHLYGLPCEIESIAALARSHGIALIEDCAEAPFAQAQNRQVGTWGDISTYSFFANKLITAGEGGAVSTSDPILLRRMSAIRSQGVDPGRRYMFEEFGLNFRLSDLSAALLAAQIDRLPELWQGRRQVETWYEERLGAILGRPSPRNDSTRSPWLFTGLLPPGQDSWGLATVLADRGVETRPIFYPLPTMKAFSAYRHAPCEMGVRLSTRGISLPTGLHVDGATVGEVCQIVEDYASGASSSATSPAE